MRKNKIKERYLQAESVVGNSHRGVLLVTELSGFVLGLAARQGDYI